MDHSSDDRTPGNLNERPDAAETRPAAPRALTRRGLLGALGGTSAIAATAGTAAVIAPATAHAEALGPLSPRDRRTKAFLIRGEAATLELLAGIPPHPTNGDEDRYPSRIGNFTKGLRHLPSGEVDPSAYESLLRALRSGRWQDFEAVQLGGPRRLVNPLAGLAFDLEGIDSHQTFMRPAPALASDEQTAEAVELYWMALLRDVPFDRYGSEPLVRDAAEELSRLPAFRGLRDAAGNVTPATLFRDPLPGAAVGPYASQFLLLVVPFGAEFLDRRIRTSVPGDDFLTRFDEWLAIQNGAAPTRRQTFDPVRRLIRNGRDLAQWVHIDFLYQAALEACLTLTTSPANPSDTMVAEEGGLGTPLAPTNPYRTSRTQDGFVTFGQAFAKTLLAEVSNRALKAVWFQKWFVHRRLRPEEYGGLVDGVLDRGRSYPLNADVLGSQAVTEVRRRFGRALLPQAYPEGSPVHPSYGAGHAAVAGASITILKALFDENAIITHPVTSSRDGLTRQPFVGPALTVGGELNKLASNVATGRNIAGVHWRTDGTEALRLGEDVAISLLRETRLTLREPFAGFTFTRFDGSRITV